MLLGAVLLLITISISSYWYYQQEQQRAAAIERMTGTLTVGSTVELAACDPYLFTGYWCWILGGTAIYEPLVKGSPEIIYPKPEDYRPWLAESWTMANDGLSYTFKLRKDVKFHDGTPFNASCVAFHMKRIMTDEWAKKYGLGWKKAWNGYLYDCLDDNNPATVIDNYTVKLNLKYKFAPFIANIGSTWLTAFESPTAVAKWGPEYNFHPVGTGPFKFVSWERGKELVLQRNDQYWGNKPKIKTMVWRTFKDISAMTMALENGEIDVTYAEASVADLPRLTKNPKLTVNQGHGDINVPQVIINYRNKDLGNPKVRQAIAQAIDREQLCKVAYKGFATPLYSVVPKSMFGDWSVDVFKNYPYDPEKAKQLLAEAGYKPGQIKVKYVIYMAHPSIMDEAVMIKDYLDKIGIDCELDLRDTTVAKSMRREGLFDMVWFGWVYDYPDAENELTYAMSYQGQLSSCIGYTQNLTSGWGYADQRDRIGKLLAIAQGSTNYNERLSAVRTLQEIYGEHIVGIPLAAIPTYLIYQNNVHGLVLTGGIRWAIDWTVVYKTA